MSAIRQQKGITGIQIEMENSIITICRLYYSILKKPKNVQDTKGKPNLRIIGIEESEDFKLYEPVNVFNIIIEENFPNIKKPMPMNIQEAYSTPNRFNQNRNSSCHTLTKT